MQEGGRETEMEESEDSEGSNTAWGEVTPHPAFQAPASEILLQRLGPQRLEQLWYRTKDAKASTLRGLCTNRVAHVYTHVRGIIYLYQTLVFIHNRGRGRT